MPNNSTSREIEMGKKTQTTGYNVENNSRMTNKCFKNFI